MVNYYMKTAFYIYTINWLFALFAQAQTLNDAYYIKIDNKILAALSETSPGIKSKGEEPHYRGFIGIDTQRPTVLKCYFDTASKKVRLEIKQAKKTRGKWALLLDKKITLTKDQSACVARLWFEVDLATLPHKDWLLEAADGLTEAPDKVISVLKNLDHRNSLPDGFFARVTVCSFRV